MIQNTCLWKIAVSVVYYLIMIFRLLQRPAYGGKYCPGPSDDCRLCVSPKCSPPIDLRAQQCSKLPNVFHLERIQLKNDVTWLPYESDQENLRCQLICRSKETGEIFYSRRNLIDGTPCSYGSTDICIQVTWDVNNKIENETFNNVPCVTLGWFLCTRLEFFFSYFFALTP